MDSIRLCAGMPGATDKGKVSAVATADERMSLVHNHADRILFERNETSQRTRKC